MKYKRELVVFKTRMGMPVAINRTDIVPLANKASLRSFARVECNKRAIARRGWNPLNRVLLEHPDVIKTKITILIDDDDNLSAAAS